MEAALAFDSGLAALRNRGTPMVSLRNLLSFVAGGARLRLGPRRLTEQRDTDGFPPKPPFLRCRRRSPSTRASPPYGTEGHRWFPSVTSFPSLPAALAFDSGLAASR